MPASIEAPSPSSDRAVPPAGSRAALAALLLCLVAAYATLVLSGQARVRTAKDDGYLAASRLSSWSEVLSNQRTFGYPLLLRGIRQLSPDYALLPHLQAGLFLGATGFFWGALVRYGLAPWTALAASLPLLGSELLIPFARRVHADTAGGAAAIAVGACLLLVVRRPRLGLWLTLGTAVFFAYQIRPAYLFLVVAIPLLAAVLGREGERERSGASPRRLVATALAVCLLPLLAFSVLRWSLVGRLGLVSFEGFNLAGIALSLLSPAVVAELPAEHRPLAQAILAERGRRGLQPIEERRFPSSRARMETWYSEFDLNAWRIASPLTFRLAVGEYAEEKRRLGREIEAATRDGADPALERRRVALVQQREALRRERRAWPNRRANEMLTGLSLAVLRQRPALYASWVWEGLRLGLLATLAELRGVALGLAAAGLAGLVGAAAAWRRGGRVRAQEGLRQALRGCRAPLWLAASVFIPALVLVALVEPPRERYLAACALFVPGALAALAWELVVRGVGRAAAEPRP